MLLAVAPLAAQAVDTVSAADSLVTMSPHGGVLHVPEGPAIPMTLIGSGLRKKKVLFINFRVYTARFLVSAREADGFDRAPDRALESLDRIPAVAMHLTFERSVSADQLTDGVTAAMNANGYDVNGDADLQSLSRAMRSMGAIPTGAVGILAAVSVDAATDLVVYQAPSGTVASIRGRSGLKRALMSAWFGTPADGGLRVLRDEILALRQDARP